MALLCCANVSFTSIITAWPRASLSSGFYLLSTTGVTLKLSMFTDLHFGYMFQPIFLGTCLINSHYVFPLDEFSFSYLVAGWGVLHNTLLKLFGFCCIALTVTRVSAAAFLVIILRSYSLLYTDQHWHQHYYLRHKTKQVVAKNSPNIGFCLTLRRYQKVLEENCSWDWQTLLHSTRLSVDLFTVGRKSGKPLLLCKTKMCPKSMHFR